MRRAVRRVAIVGSEAAKFTAYTENDARRLIRKLLRGADEAVSGECHLGGIDIWTREEAAYLEIPFVGFPPATHDWATGYRPRNIQIAERGTEVHCITVRRLPEGYKGMKFPGGCYHCGTGRHVKSGGCWTVKYAGGLGKPTKVWVIAE